MSGVRQALTGGVVCLVVACAPAPAPPVTGVEQSLRVEVTSVEFGTVLEFEVMRAHGTDYVASAWPEPIAEGARLELRQVRTQALASGATELRRYRLRVLAPADALTLVLPAWHLRNPDGSGAVVAPEQRHVLRVTSALPTGDDGQFELPSELAGSRGVHPGWWFALAAAGVWAAWRWQRALSQRTIASVAQESRAGAEDATLARLRTLLRSEVTDRVTDRSFHDEAAAIVRAWIGVSGVATPHACTREELALAWGERPGAADFDTVMSSCEQVQFARARSTTASRARLLAALARALGVER